MKGNFSDCGNMMSIDVLSAFGLCILIKRLVWCAILRLEYISEKLKYNTYIPFALLYKKIIKFFKIFQLIV